jgi:hypothetical protein
MVETVTKSVSSRAEIIKTINTRSNLYRFAWNQVFRQIKLNVADPKLRGTTFVFGQYPQELIGDESGSNSETIKSIYPLVIVQNPTITDFDNYTMDYETSQFSVNLNIEVFSERSDYLDRLSDDILFVLYNNVQTNAEVGLHNMKIVNDSYVPYERNGVNIHNRIFTIRFDVTKA